MAVLVNNLQDLVAVDDKIEALLISVVEETLRECGVAEDPEVSLVFVDNDYIAALNSQYRSVSGPTDVLSFAMQEGEPMPGDEEGLLLGDVVISLETAVRQAKEYGHSFQREVAYLTVHGVLHLLGFDHGAPAEKKLMRAREEAILNRVLPDGRA